MLYLYTNLDFEYELMGTVSQRESQHHDKMNHRWRSLLKLYPAYRDGKIIEHRSVERISTHKTEEASATKGLLEQTQYQDEAWDVTSCVEKHALHHDVLVPWGVSLGMMELAKQEKAQLWGADVGVVRKVNDKCTSHEIEKQKGVALPYSCLVDSLVTLEQAIRECPHDWVLKHPMGVSGRGRMLGRCGVVSDATKRWAESYFQVGWSLLFEPWVEDKEDFSLHLEISPWGHIQPVGATCLVTTGGGAYRGNRVTSGWLPPENSWQVANAVCEILLSWGYWGPVGIDGLVGRLGTQRIVRPLVEINARLSFGRMALALQHWIPKGWSYLWWHPTEKERKQQSLLYSSLFPVSCSIAKPGVYALPEIADPGAESRTFVLLADSPEILSKLEKQVVLL